jgi:uncharacterized GH25 family protein
MGVAFLTRTAFGHDLWLLPPDSAIVGKPAMVRAHSGMNFPSSEHAPDVAAFLKRTLILPDGSIGEIAAAGRADKSGLLSFEPKTDGVHIVAVQTAPKLLKLDAHAFNEYLVSDGLAHIYRLRVKEKSLNKSGRERYSKSPKLIFRVGTAAAGDPCRVIGLPLEVVPLHDPFALKPGSCLPVRVLFNGKPLSDANLGGTSRRWGIATRHGSDR